MLQSNYEAYSDDIQTSLAARDPDLPEDLNDRAQDNARCLCAIADAVGGHWPERIRMALVGLANARADADPASKGVILLRDIGDILERWMGTASRARTLLLNWSPSRTDPGLSGKAAILLHLAWWPVC